MNDTRRKTDENLRYKLFARDTTNRWEVVWYKIDDARDFFEALRWRDFYKEHVLPGWVIRLKKRVKSGAYEFTDFP